MVQNCRTEKFHLVCIQQLARPKCRIEPPGIYGAQNRVMMQTHLTNGRSWNASELKMSGQLAGVAAVCWRR